MVLLITAVATAWYCAFSLMLLMVSLISAASVARTTRCTDALAANSLATFALTSLRLGTADSEATVT